MRLRTWWTLGGLFGTSSSDRDRALDGWVRVVAVECEILEHVLGYVEPSLKNFQLGVFLRRPAQLLGHLVEMVGVDVTVATRPNEVAHFQPTARRHDVCQQRVAGDIERHAKEHVGTSLGNHARQPSDAVAVLGHVELEHHVTGWQGHLVDFCDVPGRHDQATGVRCLDDLVDDFLQLVDASTIWRWPAAPLHTIHRTQVALGVSPFVPNGHSLLLQRLYVRFAADEPEQLLDDGELVNLLGRDEREALGKIIPDLAPKKALGASAGAVALEDAMFKDLPKQVFVRRWNYPSAKTVVHNTSQ